MHIFECLHLPAARAPSPARNPVALRPWQAHTLVEAPHPHPCIFAGTAHAQCDTLHSTDKQAGHIQRPERCTSAGMHAQHTSRGANSSRARLPGSGAWPRRPARPQVNTRPASETASEWCAPAAMPTMRSPAQEDVTRPTGLPRRAARKLLGSALPSGITTRRP